MNSRIIILLISMLFASNVIFSQAQYIKEMEKVAEGHFADGNYNLALKKK